MWERQTPKGTGLQSCGHNMQRMWKDKDTMKRFASRGNTPHTLEAPQAGSAGAGASEPLYFNDEGQPVYTYMVSVPHVNKHLIKFPIALEHTTLDRGRIMQILLTPLCCSRQTQGQMSIS